MKFVFAKNSALNLMPTISTGWRETNKSSGHANRQAEIIFTEHSAQTQ